MAIKKYIFLFSFFLATPAFAQKGITVRDQQGKMITLDSLYSKGLLVIDFWATWCSPCLTELQGADSLLQKFPGRLNVLAVTHESDAVIKAFLAEHSAWPLKRLYITTDDSALTKLFPHRTLPHNVWIGKEGNAGAITRGSDLTEFNVQSFLNKEQLKLPVKHDALNFNPRKPYQVPDGSLTYRSLITGYNDSLNSGLLSGGFYYRRYFGYNRPLLSHFYNAYTLLFSNNINWDLIELHTTDSSRFYSAYYNIDVFNRSRWHTGRPLYEEKRDWDKVNLSCYELIMPDGTTAEQFRQAMFEDLYRYFRVKASIETKPRLCTWISGDKTDLVPSTWKSQPTVYLYPDRLMIRNVTLDQLFLRLNGLIGGTPYLNKSSQSIGFDLDIPCTKRITFEEVEKALTAHGFSFSKKVQLYPILVLDDEKL